MKLSPKIQPSDMESVVAHFRQLGLKQRNGQPAGLGDPFIGGLTYAQYFALSETDQDIFWEQLFSKSAEDMESMPEVDITP